MVARANSVVCVALLVSRAMLARASFVYHAGLTRLSSLHRINPLAYALEALMANELHGRTFACTANNLIPSGGDYTTDFAACAGVPGASGITIAGDNYLRTLSYSKSHIWRNFGILWCWWILFVGITIYLTTYVVKESSSNSVLEFARHGDVVDPHRVADEESQAREGAASTGSGAQSRSSDNKDGLIRNTSVFTWRNLKYTVKVPGGERLLLDSINGFIKPGQLGALMGSSGAGERADAFKALLSSPN
jgi:ATP-binding cassette subfamily G (WHITE) protein 2 (SNQ2)